MNLGLLTFNAVTGGNLKKQAAIVFATMTIIVALPFAAVFSMGGSVVSFLSGVPSLAAAETQGFYTGGPVEGNTYAWGGQAIRFRQPGAMLIRGMIGQFVMAMKSTIRLRSELFSKQIAVTMATLPTLWLSMIRLASGQSQR